jgi:FAD/FMN-containing dehydrogenase
VRPGAVVLDDVTRMNATTVGVLVEPRTQEDVLRALALARRTGARVCVRGTKHSMGGHSLVPQGVALDMRWVAHVAYDADSGTVTAGAGATWADVIVALNPHGKTPRTLQSYCSFSVGGTVAVNAHGITSDHPLAESVVRFTLITADGTVAVVSRGDELFGLVLGGYGLFGVVCGTSRWRWTTTTGSPWRRWGCRWATCPPCTRPCWRARACA